MVINSVTLLLLQEVQLLLRKRYPSLPKSNPYQILHKDGKPRGPVIIGFSRWNYMRASTHMMATMMRRFEGQPPPLIVQDSRSTQVSLKLKPLSFRNTVCQLPLFRLTSCSPCQILIMLRSLITGGSFQSKLIKKPNKKSMSLRDSLSKLKELVLLEALIPTISVSIWDWSFLPSSSVQIAKSMIGRAVHAPISKFTAWLWHNTETTISSWFRLPPGASTG